MVAHGWPFQATAHMHDPLWLLPETHLLYPLRNLIHVQCSSQPGLNCNTHIATLVSILYQIFTLKSGL